MLIDTNIKVMWFLTSLKYLYCFLKLEKHNSNYLKNLDNTEVI